MVRKVLFMTAFTLVRISPTFKYRNTSLENAIGPNESLKELVEAYPRCKFGVRASPFT